MRILQIRAANDGCREFRMNFPARYLEELGHVVIQPEFGAATLVEAGQFANYDIVIAQKLQDPRFFSIIKEIPKEYRPIVVYEIDDALWDIEPHNPSYAVWKSVCGKMLECISLADHVTCSTVTLKRNIHRIVPKARVHVVPNFLDLDNRNWIDSAHPKRDGNVVIGWAGGIHHYRDEESMASAICNVLTKRPNTVFAFLGPEELSHNWRNSIGHSSFSFIHPAPFNEYPSLLPIFDIGVAPLLSSEFNRCKSDLKCLEYNAWGIPFVASDIEPYHRYINEARGGGYIASSPNEWTRYLLHLIDNIDSRRLAGRRGREHVWNHRGPKQCGKTWEKTLLHILEKSHDV